MTLILASCFGGIPGGDFIHLCFHCCLLFRDAFQLQGQILHRVKKLSGLCRPLSAEGEEMDLPWHGGNSSPSDKLSSRILFLTGGPEHCLLRAAKAWLCFGVLKPGQRDFCFAGIISTSKYNDSQNERTKRYDTRGNKMKCDSYLCTIHAHH